MKILADTNIVARLAQPGHHQHSSALRAVEMRDDDLCIAPQVVYEFWVVATRPASANGLGMTVQEVQVEIARIRRIFTLLLDERAIFQHWERTVVDHDVKGKNAHDARLVAAMHRHGLTHMITFNAADFTRFTQLSMLTPDDVVRATDQTAD